MRKRAVYALSAAVAVVASTIIVTVANSWPAAAQIAGGFNFTQPQTVASGLVAPWSMAHLPDGSALVSERDSGRILHVRAGQPTQTLGTVPGVVAGGEGGLLGLAVSPTYAQDQWVYAYFTAASDNRIVRFRLSAFATQTVVVSGLAKSTVHNGGRIAFGPDGMLYAGVGDAGNTANSQNTSSRNGKILRMTPTGGVPASGNPFANSLVYSYGHRNVQGLAWDTQGRLFATEFGQNTFDEVNLIVAGGNYGWPTCEGVCSNPSMRNPIITWSPSQASPSGAAIANNNIFVAGLRGQRLWVVPITASGGAGAAVAELQNQYGRLRDVRLGPDGWLWVATSNRDGRGTPAATDDRILRFPPADINPTPTATPTASPTASPSPSPSPSASPSPGPAQGCVATYRVTNQWQGGFQGEVTVLNTGSTPTTSWQVTLTFANGQTVTQVWNGRYTQTGSTVVLRNETWNGVIAPNGTVAVGFLAGWNGVNNPPGITCARTP